MHGRIGVTRTIPYRILIPIISFVDKGGTWVKIKIDNYEVIKVGNLYDRKNIVNSIRIYVNNVLINTEAFTQYFYIYDLTPEQAINIKMEAVSVDNIYSPTVTNYHTSNALVINTGIIKQIPALSSVIAYYPFEETTGNTIYDVVGTNNASISHSGQYTMNVSGVVKKGISSSGSSTARTILPNIFDDNNLYMNFWLYLDYSFNTFYITNRVGDTGFLVQFLQRPGRQLSATYYGIADFDSVGYNVKNTRAWFNYTIEKTSTYIKIYENNTLIYDIESSYNSSSNNIYLGIRFSSTGTFVTPSAVFDLDELSFKSTAFTTQEREDIYNDGKGITYQVSP